MQSNRTFQKKILRKMMAFVKTSVSFDWRNTGKTIIHFIYNGKLWIGWYHVYKNVETLKTKPGKIQ